MPVGVVKLFDIDQGFGWIEVDGQDDVWVHYTGIIPDPVRFPSGFRFLTTGQCVAFDIEERERSDYQRRIAVNVVILD
jgi:CspA family cold shock protein